MKEQSSAFLQALQENLRYLRDEEEHKRGVAMQGQTSLPYPLHVVHGAPNTVTYWLCKEDGCWSQGLEYGRWSYIPCPRCGNTYTEIVQYKRERR